MRTPFAVTMLCIIALGSPWTADAQLLASTFLGGNGNDYGHHVVADTFGNLYIVGRTAASDFPTTPGALSRTYAGGDNDVFVAKLSPDASTLIWSTYLGGSGDDQPATLLLDGAGSVLVIGATSSTDFPVTIDAHQSSNGGGYDAFIARISPDGATLEYGSYCGGSAQETASGIRLAAGGDYVIAGTTASSDFPTTVGAYQPSYAGGDPVYGDIFAARFTDGGKTLVWSTYLGGGHNDECRAVGLDGSDNVYLAGWTAHRTGGPFNEFPTTAGAFDTSYAGDRDAVLACLSSDGSALAYATFLGDTGKDQANNIHVGADGTVWLTGDTDSSAFPTTAGAFQTTYGGVRDVFAVRVAPGGGSLDWATFLGGSGEEGYGSVRVNSGGDVVISGYTLSTDFPVTAGSFQTSLAGQSDVFVVRLAGDGSTMKYGTYFGGSLTDRGGANLDLSDNALIVGFTASPNFPITPGAYQSSVGAGWASFVSRLSLARITTRIYALNRSGAIGTLVYLRGYLYHSGYTPVTSRTLEFSVDGTPAGSSVTDGTGRATLSYIIPEAAGAGARSIVTSFAGDSSYNPSSASATLSAAKGSFTLWVLPRTMARGSTAYLRAYARQVPTMDWVPGKLVEISVDGTPLGSASTNASGMAAVLFTVPNAFSLGAHTIGANFSGDAAYHPATGSGTLTVTP